MGFKGSKLYRRVFMMSVAPDVEPSHLDLHCLLRYLYWSTGMKGLNPGSNIHDIYRA